MSSNILTNRQRKARKQHICDLCGKPIPKGAEYIYTTFVCDCMICEEHRHIHCDAMMNAAFTEYDAESYDECLEYIWEDTCETMCSFEQREECDLVTALSCEYCQECMLSPEILEAAKQSVRDCKI